MNNSGKILLGIVVVAALGVGIYEVGVVNIHPSLRDQTKVIPTLPAVIKPLPPLPPEQPATLTMELYRLKNQYEAAMTAEEKNTIKKFTLHEVRNVDRTKLPVDLQAFLKQF